MRDLTPHRGCRTHHRCVGRGEDKKQRVVILFQFKSIVVSDVREQFLGLLLGDVFPRCRFSRSEVQIDGPWLWSTWFLVYQERPSLHFSFLKVVTMPGPPTMALRRAVLLTSTILQVCVSVLCRCGGSNQECRVWVSCCHPDFLVVVRRRSGTRARGSASPGSSLGAAITRDGPREAPAVHP